MSKPTVTINNIRSIEEKPKFAISFYLNEVYTQIACTEIKEYDDIIFCKMGDIIIVHFEKDKYDIRMYLKPLKA